MHKLLSNMHTAQEEEEEEGEEEGRKKERKTIQVILNWILNYDFADTETMSQGINHNTRANLQ